MCLIQTYAETYKKQLLRDVRYKFLLQICLHIQNFKKTEVGKKKVLK